MAQKVSIFAQISPAFYVGVSSKHSRVLVLERSSTPVISFYGRRLEFVVPDMIYSYFLAIPDLLFQVLARMSHEHRPSNSA